jgi:ABC-type nitrate/sulfonate/bicarbonate transport system substrate-binding protein
MTDLRPGQPSAATMRRRNLLRWGAVGAVVALGAGYLGYQAYVTPKLSVQVGIAPGTQTLWRYVAQKKGTLFAPLGYDVTFVNFPDEASLRTAFLGGKLDIIATLVPTLASLADAGESAQMFLTIAWLKEGYPFIAPTSSPIKGLTDLAGHKIATYPLDHPGMAYWQAMALATANVNLASLNPVQTLNPDLALVQKSVDAACMGGSQWAALSQDQSFHKLTDLQTIWRQLSGSDHLLLYGGYLARPSWLAAQTAFVQDFVTAHQQAFQSYKQDRQTFLDVTAAYDNGPHMTSAENQAQATYLGYDDVGPERVAISSQDVADYRRIFGLMAAAKVIQSAPANPDSLFASPPPAKTSP